MYVCMYVFICMYIQSLLNTHSAWFHSSQVVLYVGLVVYFVTSVCVFPVWVPLRPPVGRFVWPSVWWSGLTDLFSACRPPPPLRCSRTTSSDSCLPVCLFLLSVDLGSPVQVVLFIGLIQTAALYLFGLKVLCSY